MNGDDYIIADAHESIDLTSYADESFHILAIYLFSTDIKNLDTDLTGILLDESMDVVDLFCALVEVVLYGLDILSKEKITLFDLKNDQDELIDNINRYFKSMGFKIQIKEEYFDDISALYRDNNNYYCEILPKPPSYLCIKGWYVLQYRLINNPRFSFTKNTNLNEFKAFFITKQNKIFTLRFNFIEQS